MLISFKAIGRNIRTARMDMNLTQEDVAERLKISEGTVHTHIKRAYKYIKEHLLSLLLFVLLVFKW